MERWDVKQALEKGTENLSESDKVVLERYREFHRSTMTGSSPQKQFDAAVNLIRGLPKDGPFQPSNDMKLKLYGFFKQATEGPCTQPAPSFWDLVGKAKWGAWKSLGDMPAQEAMLSYVEEIKKIMETMSLTDDMASLMDTLGPVYEYVDEEKPPPTKKKHVRFSGDEAPPATNGHHVTAKPEPVNGHVTAVETVNGDGLLAAAPETNGTDEPRQELEAWTGTATSDTDDDDEFNDPIGEPELVAPSVDETQARLDALHHQVQSLTQMIDEAGVQMLGDRMEAACNSSAAGRSAEGASACPGVHDELRALVRDMRDDLDTITGRVRSLEASHKPPADEIRPWWQLPELSPLSIALLLSWPVVLQLLLRLLRPRRDR